MAHTSLAPCARLDDSFGPHAGSCRGGFDLTLQFEETVLTLLPLGIVLLLIPSRAWFLLTRPKKLAVGNYLYVVKLVSFLFYCATRADALTD